MNEYHKIHTMFKRDMINNGKALLEGQWTCPEFEYLAENQWRLTEKVDGTNIRVMFKDRVVTFGGRTDYASLPAKLVTRLTEHFQPKVELLATIFTGDACLYGEGYGPGIQKAGASYRDDQDFVLFDVRVGGFWLRRADVEDIAKRLSIDVMPIIGYGTLQHAINLVRSGMQSAWGDFEAEGIVACPMADLRARDGSRIITKIKAKDFKRVQP